MPAPTKPPRRQKTRGPSTNRELAELLVAAAANADPRIRAWAERLAAEELAKQPSTTTDQAAA